MFKSEPQWSVFPEETIPELVERLNGYCEGPEGECAQRWRVYMPSIEAANRLRSILSEFERYEVTGGVELTHVVIFEQC